MNYLIRQLPALLTIFLLVGCSSPVKPSIEDVKSSIPNITYPTDMFDPLEQKDENISNLSEYIRVNVNMFRYGFEPENITVKQGDKVMLTITSLDVGHGFALPDFGINEKVPPEKSVTVQFTANIAGKFKFFESVYSGKDWKKMKGTFIVSPSKQSE